MSEQQPKNAVGSDGVVMIYGVVGDAWDGLDSKSVIAGIRALGDVRELTVRINSGGGYVSDGLAIYNFLAQHPARKTVVVDGIAASMASVIAMAGDAILMPANALMMIHNPWNVVIGDADELRKGADTLDKMKDSLVGIYARRTGKAEAELSEMMDAETWMSGDEALAGGFATEVTGRVEAAALLRADLSKLRLTNTPDALRRDREIVAAVAVPSRAALPAEHTQGEPDMSTTPNPAAPQAGDTVDVNALRAEATQAERQRASEIRKAVAAAKLGDDVATTLIEEGVPLDQARAKIIDAMAARDVQEPSRSVIPVTADAVDKFRAGAVAALLGKSGLAKPDASNEFRGLTLREMAREALEIRGVSTRGMRPMDMVKAAMTHSTSDFSFILQNVAEKAMLRGYEEAEETFQRWTFAGTLTDFKPASRIDLNAFPSLREVPEGAEYRYATIGDRGETIQLATYGEMFSITRQAIINDDMSVFTRIPQRMGRAAIRTVGNLVYAVLTGNPTMSDGKALFHADHKNLAGAGAAPSTATLDAMRVAMATQKDRSGNSVALNIRPTYLLVPVALEGATKVVVESEFDPSKTQRVPNSVRGIAEVISDARLDAASAAAWYAAANAAATDTIEVAYLDGVQSPTLEQEEGWKVDGLEFKVRMDAGVKALAWEGLYKNPGV